MLKIILVLVYIWCIFFCFWMIWGDLAERIYAKDKHNQLSWFWLRIFHIKPNQVSCVRYLKLMSWLGILILLACLTLTIIFVPFKL